MGARGCDAWRSLLAPGAPVGTRPGAEFAPKRRILPPLAPVRRGVGRKSAAKGPNRCVSAGGGGWAARRPVWGQGGAPTRRRGAILPQKVRPTALIAPYRTKRGAAPRRRRYRRARLQKSFWSVPVPSGTAGGAAQGARCACTPPWAAPRRPGPVPLRRPARPTTASPPDAT